MLRMADKPISNQQHAQLMHHLVTVACRSCNRCEGSFFLLMRAVFMQFGGPGPGAQQRADQRARTHRAYQVTTTSLVGSPAGRGGRNKSTPAVDASGDRYVHCSVAHCARDECEQRALRGGVYMWARSRPAAGHAPVLGTLPSLSLRSYSSNAGSTKPVAGALAGAAGPQNLGVGGVGSAAFRHAAGGGGGRGAATAAFQ
jgi:hypothetical protein